MRLEKERRHYANALQALVAKGDEAGAARLRDQLNEVQREIDDVDYRAANTRAGYVYVISNIGSFGEKMVKVGPKVDDTSDDVLDDIDDDLDAKT